MIIEEEVYLEHFGKKGMKWGVRSVKSVGRGTAKTAKFVSKHKKTTASVVLGATLAATILSKNGKTSIKSPPTFPFRAIGKNFIIEAQDGRAFDIAVSSMKLAK